MHQALLDLATLPLPDGAPLACGALPASPAAPAGPRDAAERAGFDIGWDHAQQGLVPPPALLLDGGAVGQGWHAARAVFGARTLPVARALRQWLGLRLQAWQAGCPLDPAQLSPQQLTRIETPHCPITRQPLGGLGEQAPVVVRLHEERGFGLDNLLVVSRVAAQARQGLTPAAVLLRAERMQREHAPPCDGLNANAWARWASLLHLGTPLPHLQAVRIPLRALPPPHLRLANPAQALQLALTRGLQAPGWSRRAAAFAHRLPSPALRHDFNLFVGALAARLMQTPLDADACRTRWAQEDAWADARLQRRWAQFAVQLDAPRCQALLEAMPQVLATRRAPAPRAWGPRRSSGRCPAAASGRPEGDGRAALPRTSRHAAA